MRDFGKCEIGEADHKRLPRLCLSAAEAAEALGGVSERHLQALAAKDAVPHVRLGTRIVFPVDVWREWMRDQNKRFLAQEAEPANGEGAGA